MLITNITSHESLLADYQARTQNPSCNNSQFVVQLGYNVKDSSQKIFDVIGVYKVLGMLKHEFTFEFFTKDFPVAPFYGNVCDVVYSYVAFILTDEENTTEASERIYRYVYPVRFPDGSMHIVQRDTRLTKMVNPYTGEIEDVMVMYFTILRPFDGKDFVPRASFVCPVTNLELEKETNKLRRDASKIIAKKIFSQEEQDLIVLLSEYTYKEVAKKLNKSPNTIKTDRSNLLRNKRDLFFSEFGYGIFRVFLDKLRIC